MGLIPRCPHCGQAALDAPLTPTELTSVAALPGTEIRCVKCGKTFRLAFASDWLRVPKE